MLPLLRCACASPPRAGSADDALEAQARRHDSMAPALETKAPSRPNPNAAVLRQKAADTRAERGSQPGFSEAVSEYAFDAVVDFLLFRK